MPLFKRGGIHEIHPCYAVLVPPTRLCKDADACQDAQGSDADEHARTAVAQQLKGKCGIENKTMRVWVPGEMPQRVPVLPALWNAVAAFFNGVQHMSCCPLRAKARQASLRRPRRKFTTRGVGLCRVCLSTTRSSSTSTLSTSSATHSRFCASSKPG